MRIIRGVQKMKLTFKTCFANLAVALFLTLLSVNAQAEKIELQYPNAVNKLFIDLSKVGVYESLANSVGFSISNQYSYTDYADIKRENDVGIAGAYDFLLLSTGGNGWDYKALMRMNREKCGWEMNYYSNHDLTIIHEICHDDSRSHSFVRIMKIGKGKNKNLHFE